jgi:hypothetical protein
VYANGLGPQYGHRHRRSRRRAGLTDGPFLESKEFLAGFWIIEAPDLDVALKLAAEGRRPAIGRSRCGPFL